MPKRLGDKKIAEDTIWAPDEKRDETELARTPEHLSLRTYKKTAIGFLILVLSLLSAIAYVSFAKATVTVIAKSLPVETEFKAEVRSNPGPQEIAGEVKEIVLEGESVIQISGEVKELPGIATGTVRIINELGHSQQLVATTRLLSPNGILFRIKTGVTVPGKGEVKVEIYADKEGASGNIPPSRFTIPGLNAENQKKIYAISDAPTTGGLTLKIGVGQSDIDAALAAIGVKLVEQAALELGSSWSKGVGNAEIYQKKLISWRADQKVGVNAASVKVIAKFNIIGVRYDKEKLLALAEAKLSERAREEEELSFIDKEGFEVKLLEADVLGGSAILSAHLKGKISLSAKSKILDPEQLVGLTKSSAEEYLRGFNAVEDAQVTIRPFWLRRLPNLPDRIIIKVITK